MTGNNPSPFDRDVDTEVLPSEGHAGLLNSAIGTCEGLTRGVLQLRLHYQWDLYIEQKQNHKKMCANQC